MRFDLTIQSEGASFHENPGELARLLRKVADSPDIASMAVSDGKVLDHNGNTVGHWLLVDADRGE